DEHRVGRPHKLEQLGAERGVEATDVDACSHSGGLSLLHPQIDSIAIRLTPRLHICGRGSSGRSQPAQVSLMTGRQPLGGPPVGSEEPRELYANGARERTPWNNRELHLP